MDGQKAIGAKDEIHVMIPFGDDFAFERAAEDFDHYSLISRALVAIGKSKGYDTECMYSDIGFFFSKSITENQTLVSFNGDFIPYVEPMGYITDYWTGFYTSRPHLKGLIT
jgi:hypothetical protein